VKLKKFNKAKCKILHPHWGSPWYQYRLGDEGIESNTEEKGLGILVDENLNVRQQCVLTVQKASSILVCTTRTLASRLKEVILPLYFTLGRPQLEFCIHLCTGKTRTS